MANIYLRIVDFDNPGLEMMEKQVKTIDEYIKAFPPDIQNILEKMRQTIHNAAPEAVEAISYRMPVFKLNGILVYFAAYKSHIGFYPTSSGIEAFKNELSSYKWSKGTVQFSLDKPIPYDLVEKIVRFRVKENLGSLSQYAHNATPGISIKKMKDNAWEKAAREKNNKNFA
jgi:uncharacterized protein YdhG (YjbR/CyaY superfamily)